MAGSPNLKVYAGREYVASCKHIEDAVVIAAVRGEGTTIRYGHGKAAILWTEGAEGQSASESYDHATAVVVSRMEAHFALLARRRKARG